ncbi:MAG TPA: ferrochelatase, partial [Isosphaeraceae bacterium]
AHSIPTALADRSPYVAQIESACRHVAAALGDRPWLLAWQSRSGSPHTPWLEPDVNAVLPELTDQGATDAVLCPIGFISDHVEVLYDLDLEAAQTSRDLGLNMVRAQSVNDHPVFIRALADLVRKAGTRDQGPGTRDQGPGGSGTRGTRDQGPGTRKEEELSRFRLVPGPWSLSVSD